MRTVRQVAALLAFACIGVPLTVPTTASAATTPATPGYWLAGADGGVYSFGAPFYGSGVGPADPHPCDFTPQPPSPPVNPAFGCGAISAAPDGSGYWLLNRFRTATGFAQAGLVPPLSCSPLNGAEGSWAGIASSSTGPLLTDPGYLLTASNGGVMGCGEAVPLGGLASDTLNAPVVGIAATPDAKGYWLVSSDGGVFAFGDATFDGSMGGARLNAPVVGIAATPDGKGYWLAAADGGVFSFGSAPFEGSMGGKHVNAPVVGIATYAPPVPA